MKTNGTRAHARVLAAIMLVLIVALAASGPTYSSGQARPAASGVACSKATARKLIDANQLNGFLLPPAQVLCGAFTGPGSVAMAVTMAAGTCWAVQNWAVFSFSGGSWKLVFQKDGFIYPPIVAVGSNIRVETPLFLPSDNGCNPSGGSQARLWHWNGRTFIAGAPTRAKPATPPKPQTGAGVGSASFYSPSGNLACQMINNGEVICISSNPIHKVTLTPDGRLDLCNLAGRCAGNIGEHTGVLAYGRSITVFPFRCLSETTGVTCTVIKQGKSHGKGFLINAAGVTKIGP